MKQYNVFQAIILSFYSKDLYRDVARHWNGKSFLYLLMIVALSWIAAIYQFQVSLNESYRLNSDKIVKQIPVITINKGIIKTPENRPYLIYDSDNKLFAIIDTTGQYRSLNQAKASVLITKTEIISQTKPNKTRIDRLPSIMNMVISAEAINNVILKLIGYTWIMAYLFMLLFSFLYRIIQAFLYSIIGMFFSSFCTVPLFYSQIVQLSMVAVTPAIVVATLFDYFGIVFLYQYLFYFFVAMFYLFYAILANKN